MEHGEAMIYMHVVKVWSNPISPPPLLTREEVLKLWLELVLSSTVEIVKITPRRRWSVGEKVNLIETSITINVYSG